MSGAWGRRGIVTVVASVTLALGLTVAAPAGAAVSEVVTPSFTGGVLDVGSLSTCAVVSGRAARCWGFGSSGVLGNNSTASIGADAGSMDAAGDVNVPGPDTIASISSGGSTTCAVRTTRKVVCWGADPHGVLGNGDWNFRNVGDNATSRRIENAVDVALPGPVTAVSTDGVHACALMAGGAVRCWGSGEFGALGTGDTNDVNSGERTSEVPLPDKATAISTGGGATCAVMVTGKARCWGRGWSGMLGNDYTGDVGDTGSVADAPDVILPDTARVRAISMGEYHTCAVYDTTSPQRTGRLRCWGWEGGAGALGTDGTDSVGRTPGSMAAASDVALPAAAKGVSAGTDNTCAVLVTGKVRCWGAGFFGMNGQDAQDDIGASPGSMAAATDVPLPADAVSVSSGNNHACALLTTGRIRCWGWNIFGQLGLDRTGNVGDSPGSMAGGGDVLLPRDPRTTGADLSVTATTDVRTVQEGGTAVVTVTVVNDGPDAAMLAPDHRHDVRAPLPAGTALLDAKVTRGFYDQNTSTWSFAALEVGVPIRLTLTVRFPDGFRRSSATYELASADTFDPDSTPGNAALGEDDTDTVTIETTPRPDNMKPPVAAPVIQYIDQFGTPGSGNGQFARPWDVAVDAANVPTRVWVSDRDNQRVQTFVNSTYASQVGISGTIPRPLGIAYRNQRLFVVNADLSPSVQAYNTFTNPVAPVFDFGFAYGGSVNSPGSTFAPRDVAVDPFSGRYLVTDSPFKSIQEYDPDGTFRREIGSGDFSWGYQFNRGADSIAVTRGGIVYVADKGDDVVRMYDRDGTWIRDIGSPGSCAGEPGGCADAAFNGRFDGPSGIALDQARRLLYVVDGGNDRVQVFTLNGTFLAQFGAPGTGNGQFDDPHGIAFNPSDRRLYVVDTGNDRVQSFYAIVNPPPPPPAVGGPPPACATGYTARAVVAGLAKFSGCFAPSAGGTYASQVGSVVRLNGVPIQTFGKRLIVNPDADKPTVSVEDEGAAQFSIDGKVVYSGPLKLSLPTTDKAVDEKQIVGLPAKGSIYGLRLVGKFTLSLGRSGADGPYFASFGLTVSLPEVFKFASGEGGVTGQVAVKVDEDGRVNSNGVNFTVEDIYLGPLKVNRACFALIPGGSTSVAECAQPTPYEFQKGPLSATQADDEGYLSCKPDDVPTGNHWSTAIAIQLPATRAQVGVYGSGVDAELRSLGGFGAGLHIPMAEGVFLETVGLGVCVPTSTNSELAIKGTGGIGLVPVGSESLVTIDGSVAYRVDVNKGWPWSLAFAGDVSLKGLGHVGSGGVQVFSNGTFGASLALEARVLGFLVVKGSVAGAYAPPTKRFYVEGGVRVCPLGTGDTFCVGAKGIVSNIAIAGCFNATSTLGAGFAYTWEDQSYNVIGGTCSFDDYKPDISRSAARRAAAADAPLKVTVPRAAKSVAFRAYGQTAPPGLRITGPGGFDVTSPADVPLQNTDPMVVIRNPQDQSTNVALRNVKPGDYFVTATDSANPITKLDTADSLARFKAAASVSRDGDDRVLKIAYTAPAGGKVSLAETAQGPDGKEAVHRVLTDDLVGTPCPTGATDVWGGKRLCATLRFTPSQGIGGTRQIEAVVTRNGVPSDGGVVADFRAPDTSRPPRPRVALLRSGSSVTVQWSTPRPAAGYGALVRVAGRAPTSRFLAGTCGAMHVSGVPRGAAVTASVAAIGSDGQPGRADARTVRPNAGRAGRLTRSGSPASARAGRICR